MIIPGAANVVPSGVRLLIDARAVDATQMTAFLDWLDQRLARCPAGVSAQKTILSNNAATTLNDGLVAALDRAAARVGASARRMVSGAGHDAAFMARIAPAAMVFVPCAGGRSHCPEEWAETDAIALGAEVLAETVIALDEGVPLCAAS